MSAFEMSTCRHPRFAVAGLIAGMTAFALGCATFEHGYTTHEFMGRCIRADSFEGGERLRIESDHDATVRAYLALEGAPTHVYVLDRGTVYLFDTRRDRVAIFHRELLGASELTLQKRIAGSLLKLLPPDEMDGVLARRKLADARSRATRPTRSARKKRSTPAAPQPGNDGWTLRRFDVEAIVSRLRTPATAADAGVTGWSSARSPDGSLRRFGRSGATVYEVRSDAVVTSTPIKGRTKLTSRMRLSVARVNGAVFGGHAASVNDVIHDLAGRVLLDASGRTAFARRVSGRTVRIQRVGERSRLVYSVHAQ